MTPTDAQIDDMVRHLRACHEEWPHACYDEAADIIEYLVSQNIALTAAAKFNMTDTWNSGDIPYNATKMNVTDQYSAAAEVGSQFDKAYPTMPRVFWSANKQVYDKGWSDAIERCAQVAQNYIGNTGWAVEDRVAIAAAIRALKDKA